MQSLRLQKCANTKVRGEFVVYYSLTPFGCCDREKKGSSTFIDTIRMVLLVQLYHRYEAGAKLGSAIRAIALTAPVRTS